MLLAAAGCVGSATPISTVPAQGSIADSLVVAELDFRRGWSDPGVQELAKAIGDARLVMLGEPWHGDGGAIRVRSELVQLLHEHLGFNVIAFEADFYSLFRGWNQAGTSGELGGMAAENIYHFWSISRAAESLWRYIERQRTTDRPLHVAGVDIRHVGALARATLPDELDRRLANVPGFSSSDRMRFRSQVERLLEGEWTYRPSRTEQDDFISVLDRLGVVLAARDSSAREPFWEQEIRNLRNAALYVWSGASRDRGMAENLAWLATHAYPGQKIIVWAHNNHIIKDKWMYFASDDSLVTRGASRRSLESIARSTYLGHEARQYFGPGVFALAMLSYKGTYNPDVRTENLRQRGNFDALAVLSPAAAGTVEATLASQGHKLAFFDLRRSSAAARPARALDYSRTPPLRMRYHEGYDGFLFIETTFGLNELPPASWRGSSGLTKR